MRPPLIATGQLQTALLCAGMFVCGVDNFIVAPLLPRMAATYETGTAATAQLITVYALAYAASTPLLAMAARRWPPYLALALGLLLIAAGSLVMAAVPSFLAALIGRAVAGFGAALFVPHATAVVAAGAASHRRHGAVSILMVGLAAAAIVGSPVAAWYAGAGHWQWIYMALTITALVLIIGMTTLRTHIRPSTEWAGKAIGKSQLTALISTFLILSGLYVIYTYISVVFHDAIGQRQENLPTLLFVWGCSAAAGSLLARYADSVGQRSFINAMIIALILNFGALYWTSATFWSASVVLAVWGLCAWALMVPQQVRLFNAQSGQAGLLSALHITAVYLASAASGPIGALALQTVEANELLLISIALMIAGFLMSELAFSQSGRITNSRDLDHMHCIPDR